MGKHNKGFTLLELIIVVAMLGITMGIAAPNLIEMISNNRIATAAADLATAMQQGKAEAVARVNPTTLCKRNTDGDDCVGDGDWSQGWIVFSDLNGDASVGDDDEILLVHEALHPNITFGGTAGVAAFITFRPTGASSVNNIEALVVCDERGFIDKSRGLLVTITGRGSVMKASETGQATCL